MDHVFTRTLSSKTSSLISRRFWPTIPGQDVIKFTHMFPSITVRSVLNSVRSWLRMTPNVSKLQR